MSAAGIPLFAQTILPSGQAVQPLDTGIEVQTDGERWLVLRYVAPRIAREGGDLDYADVAADMDQLCQRDGLGVDPAGAPPDQIVVVLLDRPVVRGEPDPAATQFIATYLPVAGECQWN